MPRLMASSASSRGVQALTVRSAAFSFSHGSRYDLHELLESEGGGRSRTRLIGQQRLNGLAQHFCLSRGFDGLQTRFSGSPPIPSALDRFMIDLHLPGNLLIGNPCDG